MTKRIIVQNTSIKTGTGAKGQWTKYGIMDAEEIWYTTFTNPNVVKGGEYEIEYVEGQYGNDLKSVKPVSQTSNQTASVNRNAAIVRQHSQEMALRWVSILGNEKNDLEDLKEIIDWFQKDVENQEVPF